MKISKAPWIAVAAVAIPLIALFGPLLVSDRSPALRDAAHFYYPLFEWCCREWAAGRVPLWNPYENCGVPVLADASSSVFYPGKLIFLLPLDFALRYKLYIVGHVVLAAAGSYILARAWRASQHAAAVAAIGYAFGGHVVFQYCNVVFLVGAAWLPLAALAADQMLRERSWKASLLLGIVLALMILGGDPQAAYHALLITALYAVVLEFAKRDAQGGWDKAAAAAGPPLPLPTRTFFVRISLIALSAFIAFLLAAVQILPSYEAIKHSDRAAFNRPRNVYEATSVALERATTSRPLGETKSESIVRGLFGPPERGSHHDVALDFSVGPWRLAEYFWPNIAGRMFPTHRRWMSLLPAEGRVWTPTLYLGLLPALLALSALHLRGSTPRQRWLSWLVLIFTLGSFGAYGAGWIIHEVYALLGGDSSKLGIGPAVGGVYWLMMTLLPTYAYFRYPAKLVPIVALGVSQLAAIGWDRTFSEPRPKFGRLLMLLGTASGTAALLIWLVDIDSLVSAAERDASLGPFDPRGARFDVFFGLFQAAVVALVSRWLLSKVWRRPASATPWQHAALMLTAVELAAANAWLVATAPTDIWRSESPIAKATGTAASENDYASTELPPRLFRANQPSWRPASFAKTMSPERPAEIVQWERGTLFPKYHLPSRIALVGSYGSIKSIDYESLLLVAKRHGPRQPDGSLLPQPTVLRLLGTEFLLLPEKHEPEFAERIPTEFAGDWPDGAALWKMTRSLPRAWIVHQVETMPPLAHPLRTEKMDERTKEVLFPGNRPRDFARTAVVETDKPPIGLIQMQSNPSAAIASSAGETCQIVHYDPQQLVIKAELNRPGVLVVSDAWYPGWEATMRWSPPGFDGATGPMKAIILRTNRVLRGVWLPPGQHTVEFRYQPASFRYGATISAASWLILVATGLSLRIRRRHYPKH